MDARAPRSAAADAAALVLANRWAALATVDAAGRPSGSMVAYAPEPGLQSVLVFLSGLAAHTRHLAAAGAAALVISAPDPGAGDPQTVPRVTLQCTAVAVSRDDAGFAAAWSVYVDRFPDAAPRLALSDFGLFRLGIGSARYVGGFARAATISAGELSDASGGTVGHRPE